MGITYQRKGQLRADSCTNGKVTSLDPLRHSCPPNVSPGYVMDTLYSGNCDCANDFPSMMRALTWSHYCKYQYVLFWGKNFGWMEVWSLNTEYFGDRWWLLYLKAFLIWGETGRITSFYYILTLALQLNSEGKPQSE